MNIFVSVLLIAVLIVIGIWCAAPMLRVPKVVMRLSDEVGLTDEAIYEKLKGHDWMLACATAAYKKSDGMYYGFETWWRLSADNWTRRVQPDMPGLSSARLRRFLLSFARNNQHKTMNQVAAESAAAVGKPAPMIIGPGETVEVTMPFDGREHDARDLDWRRIND